MDLTAATCGCRIAPRRPQWRRARRRPRPRPARQFPVGRLEADLHDLARATSEVLHIDTVATGASAAVSTRTGVVPAALAESCPEPERRRRSVPGACLRWPLRRSRLRAGWPVRR